MTLRLPSLASVLAILLAFLAFAWVVRECSIPEPPRTAPVVSLAPLRDSLMRARVLDSVRLRAWADSVVALRGDSLRSVFSRRAAALRPRIVHLPGAVDTVRDSVFVAGADLRTFAIADSACWDSVAAMHGTGMLRASEDSARIVALEGEVRSLRRSRWIWMGAGAVLGRASCLVF